MNNKKLFYHPAERNKDPILQVLKRYVVRGIFLEIASGSGQHVAHFAPHFPQVMFYPSEKESRLLQSIEAHSYGDSNIKRPVYIDVTTNYQEWGYGIFQPNSIDYIYNANMIHISPYECTVSLFNNAGLLLKPNGLLITYGPYAFDGKITPESNVIFDKNLRLENSKWGLRDVRDLKELAKNNNILLVEIVDMPANNKTIIWRKCASS